MFLTRLAVLILSCLLAQTSAPQQQRPPQSPQRDQQALTLLASVVAALGGAAAWSTTAVIARGNLTAATGGISGPITWENVGTEFRYERPGPNGPIVYVSGHGNPAIVDNGKAQRNIAHLAMVEFPWHLPSFVLAARLNNALVQVGSVEQVTVDGAPTLKLVLTDQTDSLSAIISKQAWYFDPSTLLPVRVEYLASEVRNALNTAKMTILLSDWRKISGLLVPFHIVTYFEGQQISDVALTSVQLNAPITTSDFDLPEISAGGAQ